MEVFMKKERLSPKDGAEIMGAYSHGIKVDIGDKEMIFVTGQIAQDSNGNVVCEDIEGQTEYVFNCIQKILNEANSSLDDVVKTQIFLFFYKKQLTII
jgi:2-iminobutanoate/2-iminopropanoate deaminase